MNKTLKLLLAFTFIYFLVSSVWWLLFNLFLLERKYEEKFIGLLLGSGAISVGFSFFVAGAVSRIIGLRQSIFIGITLEVVCLFVILNSDVKAIIIMCSIINGFATALISVGYSTLIASATSEKNRTEGYSIQAALSILAAVIGLYLGGILPDKLITVFNATKLSSYYFILSISLAGMCLCLIPVIFIKKTRPSVEGTNNTSKKIFNFVVVLKNKLLWRFCLIAVLIGLGAGYTIPLLNVFFRKKFGVDDAGISRLFIIGQVFLFFGFLAVPFLSKRLGKVKTIFITQLLSLPFLLMLGITNVYLYAAIAYVVRGFMMNVNGPVYSAFLMDSFNEEERPLVQGFHSGLWNCLWGVGNMSAGVLFSMKLYGIPFVITFVLYSIAVAGFLILFKDVKQKPTVQTIEKEKKYATGF